MELIEEVGDDPESEVVVVDETVEVFEAREAVLERVGCGAELALRNSGASRFFGIGTVDGKLGDGNGLGRLRIGVRWLIRGRLRVWGLVFHRSHSSKRKNGLEVGQNAEVPKI